MKKGLKRTLLSICTSIFLLVPTTAFAADKKGGTIIPMGGTGYVDAYKTASDYTRIILNQVRMNDIQIVVTVLNGHFYSDAGGNKTVYLDRADSQWTNNGRNCDILSQGTLYTTNNTNFSQNVQVRGLGSSYSYTQGLSKTEALNLVRSGSAKVSVPGFGDVTTELQVQQAYSTTSSQSCTVSVNSNFSQWYSVKTNITGIGTIYTECSM